jgi:hypothetical protein
MKILEEQFRILLRALGPSLTTEDVEQTQELVDHNELGVAFENFCTQLYELDVTCSPDQLTQIASIGTAMGISSEYWTILKTT